MSEAIVINKVTNETDKMKFIKFPWKIYKNYPNWVPPLIFDVKNNLDIKKNPFYHHSKIELFLAYKGTEIVGRIAGIINDNHNKFHEDKIGFWGYFDCINDKEVASALFDSVHDFLLSQGMDTMRGPINLSTNDEIGLLIDSYDKAPYILTLYNPEYYIKLVEDYGFTKAKDLYAYQLTKDIINDKKQMDKLERVSNIVMKRENLTIRKINFSNFNSEVETLHTVYNDAWEKNWGFVPMTHEEFFHIAKMLKAVADPDYVYIAEHNGKPVGFSLTLPDFNQIFKKINGRLFPFGAIKILTGRKKINQIRVFAMGIVRDFQKKGTEAVFIRNTILNGIRKGVQECEISWVLEDNAPMVQTAENLGAKKSKTFRLYDKQIANNK
jgi:hypothetical protein